MIKKKKILKKILIKKNLVIKQLEKTIIRKSILKNLKVENYERFFISKQKKKKNLSSWQNACFFLGLYKKLWKKGIMSRYSFKLLNNHGEIPNIKLKTW